MSQKLNKLDEEINRLYERLLEAQLDHDWPCVDSIRKAIKYLEERESSLVKDTQNLRDHEGTV